MKTIKPKVGRKIYFVGEIGIGAEQEIKLYEYTIINLNPDKCYYTVLAKDGRETTVGKHDLYFSKRDAYKSYLLELNYEYGKLKTELEKHENKIKRVKRIIR